MELSLQKTLGTSIRTRQTATMGASSSGVLDAGKGFSFVGFQVQTALAAGTTLTFTGYAGGDDAAAAPAVTDLDPIRVENNDGTAAASYTVEVDTDLGYFPLDAAVFNGCRYITIESDENNNGAEIELVSKPL
jgi:hypothetical protein